MTLIALKDNILMLNHFEDRESMPKREVGVDIFS